MTRITYLAFLLAVALPMRQAHAWNDAGHRIVARIAWEVMTPAARARAVTALKAHPRFQRDFAERMPVKLKRGPQERQDLWIFLHAAGWPDLVRGFRGQMSKRFHRATWHYINIPIWLSDDDRVALEGVIPTNLARNWDPDAEDQLELNVIQAIAKNRAILNGAPDGENAGEAICWLSHLIGDLHQPLHASSIFSRQRFPKGDRGGNDIPYDPGRNLHSHWDNIVARDSQTAILEFFVERVMAQRPMRRIGEAARADLAAAHWADESFELARKYAYTERVFRLVDEGEADAKAELKPLKLSDDQKAVMRAVATKRMVQAGYRLAAVLEAAYAGR